MGARCGDLVRVRLSLIERHGRRLRLKRYRHRCNTGHRHIDDFTMKGQALQVMLSTAKVTVRSPARAADAVIIEPIRTRALASFFMGRISSLC